METSEVSAEGAARRARTRARAWGFARARNASDPFGTRISMRLLSGLCFHPLCSRGARQIKDHACSSPLPSHCRGRVGHFRG